MNEIVVIDQVEIQTALDKAEGLKELFNLPTILENAQVKKDASLELSKIAKLLDSKRQDAVKPALEEQRRINGIFKPVLDKLESMSKGLLVQVQEFVKEEKRKENIRNAELARIEAEKLLSGEKVSTPEPVKAELPKVSETKVWVYEIADENQIPRDFLEPSDRLIIESIKAGVRSIPGIKIYQETRVGRR